jgi:anaerobic glycerol-3-phosphate dehydrogenase
VSDYHSHGFGQFTKPVAAYDLVAGLAAYPVEALSLELLEYDRIRRAPQELRDVAKAEI